MVKNLYASAGDAASIPGLERSPREGNGNPLQYSCLGNPMDRGAWQAKDHVVAKNQTWLSNWTTKGESKRRKQNCLLLSKNSVAMLNWTHKDPFLFHWTFHIHKSSSAVTLNHAGTNTDSKGICLPVWNVSTQTSQKLLRIGCSKTSYLYKKKENNQNHLPIDSGPRVNVLEYV